MAECFAEKWRWYTTGQVCERICMTHCPELYSIKCCDNHRIDGLTELRCGNFVLRLVLCCCSMPAVTCCMPRSSSYIITWWRSTQVTPQRTPPVSGWIVTRISTGAETSRWFTIYCFKHFIKANTREHFHNLACGKRQFPILKHLTFVQIYVAQAHHDATKCGRIRA